MEPSAKEIAAVASLPGTERYRYFVKKVCDTEELWSLRDGGGWCVAADGEGREGIPVWSSRAFAVLCTHDRWASSLPESISLEGWRTRWLPGLERDGRTVIVFPVPSHKGVIVDPARLATDIQTELAEWYGEP